MFLQIKKYEKLLRKNVMNRWKINMNNTWKFYDKNYQQKKIEDFETIRYFVVSIIIYV